MGRLTSGRQALWSAIENYSELRKDGQSVFSRMYRYDEDEQKMEGPRSAADLPAVMILPAPFNPTWAANIVQEWPYVLNVQVWTPRLSLPDCEDLTEKVIEALYFAKPPNSAHASYVKIATGHIIKTLGSIEFTPVSLQDSVTAWQSTVSVALRILKDFPSQ